MTYLNPDEQNLEVFDPQNTEADQPIDVNAVKSSSSVVNIDSLGSKSIYPETSQTTSKSFPQESSQFPTQDPIPNFYQSQPDAYQYTPQPNPVNQNNYKPSEFQNPNPNSNSFTSETNYIPETSYDEQNSSQNYQNNRPKIAKNINPTKALSYILLALGIGLALFIQQLWGLILFWILGLVAIRLQPKLAWVIVLVTLLFIVTTYPLSNYITLAGIGLTLISALFLGFKPNLSKFNRYLTTTIAIICALWVCVPMSQIGVMRFLQNQYTNNSLFKLSVDSVYKGVGSPKLSTAEIEKNFKAQISADISNQIKGKTSLLPEELVKVKVLCDSLGETQNLNETCQNLDKEEINKNIDNTVENQVNQQVDDLKGQFNNYPQVQIFQNFFNGLFNLSDNSYISSPYTLPFILLAIIYVFLSGILQIISWPIILILKRLTLS